MKLVPLLSIWLGSVASSSVPGCPSSCSCADYGGKVRVDCKGRRLTEIPKRFPDRTMHLDLSNNQIEFIDELPDLTDLVFVNFTSNKIRDIHYDAFDSLDSLTTLVLSHNELSSIADDIFEWNPLKLKRIYLDNNRFEYIQHFLFYDLTEIEEIDLHGNQLAFVHPHAFTELENLNKLDLSNNKLRYFQDKWVSKIISASLSSLKLTGNPFRCDCQLTDANMRSFLDNDAAKKLIEYALYAGQGNGQIMCSADGDFKHQDLLKITPSMVDQKGIKCTKPRITGISKSSEVEAGKSLLLKCIATGNPMPTIEWKAPNEDVYRLTSDDFEGVTVHQDGSMLIEDIRTSDKGTYTCIAKGSQGSVQAETKVDVTGDDDEFNHGKGRDDLDWIDDDEDDDYNLWWDPSEDKLYGDKQEIDDTHITDLQEDHIDYQDFTFDTSSCPKGCQCMANLADCGETRATAIPSKLPKNIVHLDMNGNDVQKIPSRMCKYFPKLRELKIDENRLSEISDRGFEDCAEITILTMRKNKLTEIKSNAFNGLHDLQILVLDANLIQTIDDDVFTNLKKLEYLYMRENSIKSIHSQAFSSLPAIRFIHLEDNQIETLKLDWIQEASYNRDLKRVFLGDNKIVCDQRISDFEPYLGKKAKRDNEIWELIAADEVYCYYPSEMSEKPLVEIDYKNLPKLGSFGTPEEPSGGGAGPGMMIGGILLGAVLTACGIIAWRKWNRRNGMGYQRSGFGGHSYQDISQEDNESRALTQPADQEAFI